MRRQWIVGFLMAVVAFGIIAQELIHHRRFGHFAPLALHADILATTQTDMIGIEGHAHVYDASLTNLGIFPATITVCDYLDYSSSHATMVAYIVGRWDQRLKKWVLVPEWDEYGNRLFCRESFEITETHLVQRRLWPGQSLRIGQIVPAGRSGLSIGDYVRFIVFPFADGDISKALYTPVFCVDQQVGSRKTSSSATN